MSETIAISDYPSMMRALVARRHQLKMSQLDLEHRAGLADGHISKLESGRKNLGPISFPCVLGALDAVLILVPTRATRSWIKPTRQMLANPDQLFLPIANEVAA